MYDNGEGGYKKDKKKAAELYRESAEEGYMDAQKNLAAMYYKGEGVKQNDSSAYEWMRKSAEQGYEPAVNEMKNLEGSK